MCDDSIDLHRIEHRRQRRGSCSPEDEVVIAIISSVPIGAVYRGRVQGRRAEHERPAIGSDRDVVECDIELPGLNLLKVGEVKEHHVFARRPGVLPCHGERRVVATGRRDRCLKNREGHLEAVLRLDFFLGGNVCRSWVSSPFPDAVVLIGRVPGKSSSVRPHIRPFKQRQRLAGLDGRVKLVVDRPQLHRRHERRAAADVHQARRRPPRPPHEHHLVHPANPAGLHNHVVHGGPALRTEMQIEPQRRRRRRRAVLAVVVAVQEPQPDQVLGPGDGGERVAVARAGGEAPERLEEVAVGGGGRGSGGDPVILPCAGVDPNPSREP